MSPTPEQPYLNGGYYGPPIPPKTKSSHRPSSRGGGGGCNPLTCCFSCICSCIFNLIFQILITVGIFIGIICLIFWFIFRPNIPKFHVNDVTLTKFTLSETNNTLYYNLSVNMTFRNPNKRLGIYYDKIEANSIYDGYRFASYDIPGFYLGHKQQNDNVTVTFKGEQLLVGKTNVVAKYDNETKDEVYKLDLKLRLKIRFKVWWMKTPKFKPKLDCDLKVPLNEKGNANSVKFERTKCDFDW